MRMKSLVVFWVALLLGACVGLVSAGDTEEKTVAYTAFNSDAESLVALTGNYSLHGFVCTINVTGLVFNGTTESHLARVRVYDGATTDYLSISYIENATGWFVEADVVVNSVNIANCSKASSVNATVAGVADRLIISGNSSMIYHAGSLIVNVDNEEYLTIDNYDVQGSAESWMSGNAYLTMEDYSISYQVSSWIPMIITVSMLGLCLGLIKKLRR